MTVVEGVRQEQSRAVSPHRDRPLAPLGHLSPPLPPQPVRGPVRPAPRAGEAPAYANPSEDEGELRADLRRQIVDYRTSEAPGTIIVDTPEHLPLSRAARRQGDPLRHRRRPRGFTWSGVKTVERKAEWPDWTPPPEMIARQPYLPRFMAGGATNPLGARAMYLSGSVYRIHGTNAPWTIGTRVSSGCIRMVNEDVIDLYSRVKVGTKVVVLPCMSSGRGPVAEQATPPRPRPPPRQPHPPWLWGNTRRGGWRGGGGAFTPASPCGGGAGGGAGPRGATQQPPRTILRSRLFCVWRPPSASTPPPPGGGGLCLAQQRPEIIEAWRIAERARAWRGSFPRASGATASFAQSRNFASICAGDIGYCAVPLA